MDKLYLAQDAPITEWPFKEWTLYQLRKTCEYNKDIAHCCVNAFNNYTKHSKKQDLIQFMEQQMNQLISTLNMPLFQEKWTWDGYIFVYNTKKDAYQIKEIQALTNICPKCGHGNRRMWKHCQYCLEILPQNIK